MPADSPETIYIDARGHKCPVPTLKLRRALEKGISAFVIELLADDPMAQIDIPHFCQQRGLPAPEVEALGGDGLPPAYWRFVICANMHD